jgi:hypothetical protein
VICSDGRLFFAGATKPITDLVTHTPRPAWLQAGDAPAARRLLTMAEQADPTDVGPPFTVLELDGAGGPWKGNPCAASGSD